MLIIFLMKHMPQAMSEMALIQRGKILSPKIRTDSNSPPEIINSLIWAVLSLIFNRLSEHIHGPESTGTLRPDAASSWFLPLKGTLCWRLAHEASTSTQQQSLVWEHLHWWFRRKVNQVTTPRGGILLGDICCLVTTEASQAFFLSSVYPTACILVT